ncbi:hypothetical protein [Catenibacterium mitsuokai]|uniref:hypothetical protein n=2 Tax=Catenibacterium mitsuokai TaxID=100886 RepID=UPI003F8CD4D0
MDTVYNGQSGPFMQTFKFLSYSFIFIIYHEEKSAKAMVESVDPLESILGKDLFLKEVKVIKTDRGSEFSDAEGLEKDNDGSMRTYVFYCDSMASCHKGSLENNHKEVYADIGINLLMRTKILCRVNLKYPLIIIRFSLFSRHNNVI